MTFGGIQAEVAAQIMSVPALAALVTPMQFSLSMDPDAVQQAESAALKEKGVFMLISGVVYDDGEGSQGRWGVADGWFIVGIAENPKVAHSPSGEALMDETIRAVTKRISSTEAAPIFKRSESEITEQGYVLQRAHFVARVAIR